MLRLPKGLAALYEREKGGVRYTSPVVRQRAGRDGVAPQDALDIGIRGPAVA